MSIIIPSIDMPNIGAVELDLWLCNTSDMSQIGQLDVHQRQLQVQLDAGGVFTGWVHLLDEIAPEIKIHQTSLRIDRNGDSIWSGEILQANDSSSAADGQQEGTDQCQITANGWFQILNMREVHCGAEFSNPGPPAGQALGMLELPNGQAWESQFGAYEWIADDTATQLVYASLNNIAPLPSGVPVSATDALIIFDLLNRANIDSPTLITPGQIYGTPYGRNLTLQRLQNIGQQITQLVNTESGCDFDIDPVTRRMNLYGPGASSSRDIPNGKGIDRGLGTIFTYPGNCVAMSRSGDGTQTENRVNVMGQYDVGRADDVESQEKNGLFEGVDELSEVVDPNILAAYANAEVAVRAWPWTILTFTPRAVTREDRDAPGVPRPWDDFDEGDIVYCVVDRGRTQVGIPSPQQTRLFGWTTQWDDNGIEKLTQAQTTYQSLGSSAT